MISAALAALASFLVLRSVLAPLGLVGVTVAEWVGLLGVGWWILKRQGRDLGEVARLVPVPVRSWVGAMVLAGAGVPLAWAVTWLQSPWIGPDPAALEALNQGMVPESLLGLLLLFLAAALTPAICEEVVFRGLLLQGLRDRIGDTGAVLAAAALFGAVHWLPGLGFRVLPLATVGILLGWVVVRSGSLIPALLLHTLHNAGILLAGALAPPAGEEVAATVVRQPPPPLLLVGGVAFLALGAQLLAPSPSSSKPSGSTTLP